MGNSSGGLRSSSWVRSPKGDEASGARWREEEPPGGFHFDRPTEFVQILEDWRADGGMKGLELG